MNDMAPNLIRATPTSFDFGGQALRPDYVVKCSYGNDSIALLQWLYEHGQKHPLGKVVVLYNDTGWATSWWPARVENGERLVKRLGFIPAKTESKGMAQIVSEHAGWPDHLRRFCTVELKVWPTLEWLALHDPDGKAEMVCGVRREESHSRRLWPEYNANGPDEGRGQWSPLILVGEAQRDELIRRAGWEPLPHRSRECRCINANRKDLRTWSEQDVADVAAIEQTMSERYPGKIKLMFHPKRWADQPIGIRAVVDLAKLKGQEEEAESDGCDSGYCSA
jgi:3'-phosphoadenosine 5'-phosphosulfate sulfotransferase (PAPS reductase)/FAD synthetase